MPTAADWMSEGTLSASVDEHGSLERLVQHFVAAKRSLSSATLVSRANDIVTSARALVEESAVLTAKNTFVRRGVIEEVNVLGAVRDGLDGVGREADVDFKAVVRRLDHANDRLQATLVQLSNTIVDTSSLHSRGIETGDASLEKTLHDFIDESTHLSLIESLRITIDSYNDAQSSFQHSQDSLDDGIRSLDAAVNDADQVDMAASHLQDKPPPIPPLFHALTHHATETASLLSSLVSHYDLCATALKHTEGGGEAARQATHPSPDDQATDDSLYKEGVRHMEPMSADERHEMLQVVDNDAQEVDDVILEIREHLAEMETQLAQLSTHAYLIRTRHSLLSHVLNLLRKLGTDLPSHIAAAKLFTNTWASLKEDILSKTDELASLTDFYDSFITSYSSLLREVTRRQTFATRMKRIAEKATRDLEAIYNEDVALRHEFVQGTGEYLPRDIWPGLVEAPRKWHVRAVSPEPSFHEPGLELEPPEE